MDESRQKIRFEIEGLWSAEEMGRFFLFLSELYNLRLFLELLREEARDLDRFYELIGPGPFDYRRGRRLTRRGLYPWAFGLAAGLPPIWNEAQIGSLSALIEPEERLDVRRISYASPGSVDLIGIGAIVGHVKDFTLKLIDRQDSKQQRKLSEERAELENDRVRIENARSFVALARDLGYTDSELRQLVARVDEKQETLVRFIEQQKLRTVSILDATDKD